MLLEYLLQFDDILAVKGLKDVPFLLLGNKSLGIFTMN
jgi:hypothetical protein